MYVALKGEEISTIGEIAESYAISKSFDESGSRTQRQRLFDRSAGKNGGLRLNGRAEDDINIGGLVRDTEQDLAIVECFTGAQGCTITPACHLKSVFAAALEAFLTCSINTLWPIYYQNKTTCIN